MNERELRIASVRTLMRDRFNNSQADLARAIDRDDSQVWQMLNNRGIGEKMARHIEVSLGLRRGSLDDGSLVSPYHGGTVHELREASPAPAPIRNVPIVGTAQLGEDGFYVELDYPPGHGDGFIPWPTRDASCYALRVRGDSMRPRIKPGEFVLVEPLRHAEAGEEVLVRTKDGRVMVKVLDFRRNGTVQLSSINEAHRPVTLEESEIERLHYVAAIIKPNEYYNSIS